jgi:hypothetical protein
VALKLDGGGIHDDMFASNAPSKADRKRAHREAKHKLINERIVFLRQKYTGMTANQRASEARQYADRELSQIRKQAVILSD